ncbi:MAG: ChaN family lipoprotein [Verrucomicrobiales bacterium]
MNGKPSLQIAGALLLVVLGGCAGPRSAMWVDLVLGETTGLEPMLVDLASADVVYLGETHRLPRHHRLQRKIFEALDSPGRPVILGLEQVEARNQGALDAYNRGEIDFDALAESIEWGQQWSRYEDYRALVESARDRGVRVVGLNAPREVIRAVGRNGVASLSSSERGLLPRRIYLDDPVYERLMVHLLSVHAAMDPEFLRHVFEAQAARDEAMAASLVAALEQATRPGSGAPLAVVVTGSGHVQFGLGTPERVRRRRPGIEDRIVLMSEAGDLELTEAELAMSREIETGHGDLKFIERPLADYLHAVGPFSPVFGKR